MPQPTVVKGRTCAAVVNPTTLPTPNASRDGAQAPALQHVQDAEPLSCFQAGIISLRPTYTSGLGACRQHECIWDHSPAHSPTVCLAPCELQPELGQGLLSGPHHFVGVTDSMGGVQGTPCSHCAPKVWRG